MPKKNPPQSIPETLPTMVYQPSLPAGRDSICKTHSAHSAIVPEYNPQILRMSHFQEKQVEQSAVLTKEQYTWQAIGGIQVPTKIMGENSVYRKSGDHYDHVVVFNDWVIHWFSVNQPMSDELFSQDILVEPKSVFDLTDDRLFELE